MFSFRSLPASRRAVRERIMPVRGALCHERKPHRSPLHLSPNARLNISRLGCPSSPAMRAADQWVDVTVASAVIL